MEPTDDDTRQTVPQDWKWQALFDRPADLDTTWREWLAGAQRAEQEALLRYWARRSTSGTPTAG